MKNSIEIINYQPEPKAPLIEKSSTTVNEATPKKESISTPKKINNSIPFPSNDSRSGFNDLDLSRFNDLTLSDEQLLEISSLLKDETEKEPVAISINNVENLLHNLITNSTPKKNKEIILSIKNLLNNDSPEIATIIQKKITEILQTQELTISTLVLLGELTSQEAFSISDELIKTIEFNNFPTPQLMDQLKILNRLNNEEGNLLIHKILDYFEQHLFILQNDFENKLTEERHEFYANLHYHFLQGEVRYSKNYLVKKHLQDQIESLEQSSNKNKPGSVSGISGGTNDSTIYTYKHAREAYNNRIALGIKNGFVMANPLLRVAPGYYGYYQRGKLTKVFSGPENLDSKKTESLEKELVASNNPKYNYIYNRINSPDTPLHTSSRYPDDSYKLEKLNDIWSFKKNLKDDQCEFFYDLSQLDLSHLHPVVVAEFLHNNIELLSAKQLLQERESLNEDELTKKVSLHQNDQQKDLYQYKNLSSLHMRKKIEDDFGVDISSFDFLVQKNFLNFLETRTVNDVVLLQNFVKKHGANGLKTFLSLEFGGKEIGEKILKIDKSLENLPLASKLLFTEYTKIVDSAQEATEQIFQLYNEIFFEKHIDKDLLYKSILKKASLLFTNAEKTLSSSQEENKEEVINELIANLQEEQVAQQRSLQEFKKILTELNQVYKEALKEYENVLHANFKQGSMAQEVFSSEEDREDYEDYLDMMHDMENHPSIASSANEAHEMAIENERHEKNFDSQRLEIIIDEMKNYIESEGIYTEEVKSSLTKIEKLLYTQKSLETKLDKIVTGEFHAETDNKLLGRYQEIRNSIQHLSSLIKNGFGGKYQELSQAEISDELLKDALAIISTPTSTPEEQQLALEKLDKAQTNILLLEKVLGQLSRDEIAELNLREIPIIEKMENTTGSELLKNHDLIKKLIPIIRQQFPKGDAGHFISELKNNPNLSFNATLINGEVISFFTKDKISENINYVDWFISNPGMAIKGLGAPTIKLGFDELSEQEEANYAVVKLHVKSAYIFIEKLGFVAFGGSTADGEYKDHYVRTRRFPEDNIFVSKNISADKKTEFNKTLDHLCPENNHISQWVYNGRILNVCRVEYKNKSHHDDIVKNDPDGWLLAEIERQQNKGYVMTRLIPRNEVVSESDEINKRDRNEKIQCYYAIFEKDHAKSELKDELNVIVENRVEEVQANKAHSDSKKAVNS